MIYRQENDSSQAKSDLKVGGGEFDRSRPSISAADVQTLPYESLATSPEDGTTSFDGTVAAVYTAMAAVVYFDGEEDQPVHVILTQKSGGAYITVAEGEKARLLGHPRVTADRCAADYSLQELPRVLAVKVEVLQHATDATTCS